MFIRDDIPSKLIESKTRIEGFFVELKNKKWPLCCSYNPRFSQISFHWNMLGKNFDSWTSKNDNITLLGDFNTEPNYTTLSNFWEIYNLKNFIKDKNCFENPNKPSYINLTITNRPKSFQNYVVIETGLSDFHKMCITVRKYIIVNKNLLSFIIVNSRI